MRSRYKRRPNIAIGFVVFFVLLILFIFGLRSPDTSDRVSVVVATSPMTVWSWDRSDNSFIQLTIPSDYVINALYGYGYYSLDAIWRLGFIDKKGGTLLSDSLSDTLGLPIDWYIGTKSQELPNGKELFSLSNIFSFIERTYQTNMPIGLFISFSRALTAARPDKIQHIDAGNVDIVTKETLPDGSERKVLSPDFLDHELGGIFVSELLRTEGLSVALYNTTSVPELGNRTSRLLTNAGILVVMVGNDEPEITTCVLTGGTKVLQSKTAAFITSVFKCKKVESSEEKRADLIVRIGTEYAKRF
jgi:hypothetical protein